MSQELERVYTINLGKVLLSPNNIRAKRAINMIREFARHHMKIEDVKIDEDVAHHIWSRGIKHPPRKIRVRITRTDEGYVLVSSYDEDIDAKVESPKEEQPAVSEKVDEAKPETQKIETSVVAEPKSSVEKPKSAKAKEAKPKPAKAKEEKPKPAKAKEAKPKPAKAKEAKPKPAKAKEAKPKPAKSKETPKTKAKPKKKSG